MLKAKATRNSSVGLLWEVRLKELLFSVGSLVDFGGRGGVFTRIRVLPVKVVSVLLSEPWQARRLVDIRFASAEIHLSGLRPQTSSLQENSTPSSSSSVSLILGNNSATT